MRWCLWERTRPMFSICFRIASTILQKAAISRSRSNHSDITGCDRDEPPKASRRRSNQPPPESARGVSVPMLHPIYFAFFFADDAPLAVQPRQRQHRAFRTRESFSLAEVPGLVEGNRGSIRSVPLYL